MSNNTVTFSSELMKNYKQAEVMSPELKFEALQTDLGNALLFSIGTDNAFYVTQEQSGSSTGWEKTDLSSAQIEKDFQGKTGVTCKIFDVAENIVDGTIGLAMVINDTEDDYLYLCLGNSNSDTGWLDQPNYVSYPFDDDDHPLSSVSIVNVFLSETSGNVQYIVVDVLQDPDSDENLVYRYYIDTQKTDGYAWHPHDISFALEAEDYSSCLGRQSGQQIDGLYTSGQIDDDTQLVYQPLYNVWDPSTAANSSRLYLPDNATPDAIAVYRNSDSSTDLYASAAGKLYYFAASNQDDQAQAELLFESDMFTGITKLYVDSSDDNIVVWGLNGNDEIFYATCPSGKLTTSDSWSCPLPILTGVDMVSPYVNRANNGNVFFAVSADELKVAVQSPQTFLWKFQSITLPALDTDPSQKFSSYTTRIQVTDENNQPVSDTAISLSARSRTGVYINHLYYVLDTDPIQVSTDQLGSLTIIEWIDGLQGTQLTVTGSDGTSFQINPMDTPFNKVIQLNTVDNLQNATITNSDGSTEPLISSGTDESDLQQVADSMNSLSTIYSNVSSSSTQLAAKKFKPPLRKMTSSSVAGFEDAILVEAGDLFSWLSSGVESVIEIIEDEAEAYWYFIATIEEQAYSCILDGVEKVVGAVEWVFNVIETDIEDLISFLEFLFEWNDITNTKKVIKNLFKLFLQDRIDNIESDKEDFNGMIDDLKNAVNSWSDMTDWSGLGDASSSTLNSDSDPTSGLSSSTTMLSHHFENNSDKITQIDPPQDPTAGQDPIDTLIQALTNEGEIISDTFSQLEDLASNYSGQSLSEVLDNLLVILTDAALDSAQNVVDAIFDILSDLASFAMEILDTTITIPVVSDILSDFGVSEISMLDLFCWLTAVPVTITYKAAYNEAPFPDDDSTTSFLINATNFQDVIDAFPSAQSSTAVADSETKSTGSLLTDEAESADSYSEKAIFVTGHCISGFAALMSAIVASLEAAEETGENAFSIPSALLGVLSGVSDVLATTLVPKYPIENSAANWTNRVTSGMRLLSKLILSGSAQEYFATSENVMEYLAVDDGRATGAIIDSVLVIPALVCSCWHYYELSNDPASDDRTDAIIEETSNVTSYFSRIGYATAVNTEDPDTKTVAIGIMAIATLCYSGLQTAESLITG